jgi:ATP-dependent helicase/nuclease subunit A
MREAARGHSPFAFYAGLLGAGLGRKKFLARLGHEASDALDEFLNLALNYERIETPSLQGFVSWLRAAQAEVKRDMEMERDEVRVMTVHGAKGLEAPIVILADTTTPPQGWHPPKLLRLPPAKPAPGAADRLVWAVAKEKDVGPMGEAREAARAEASDEYRRLLYVAMTRAAERLIVCGVKGKNKIPDGCWYQLVHDALKDGCVSELADDGESKVWRYRKTPEPPAKKSDPPAPARKTEPLPDWLAQNVPAEIPGEIFIRPSDTGGDEPVARTAPAAGDRATALLRGRLTHRLLQSLPDIPPERRAKAMIDYLARAGADLTAEDRSSLAEQVTLVLDDPRFNELYGAQSRAEVPIVGRLQIGGTTVRVSGQVDRLAVTQASVLIGDFKTDRRPPRRIEDVAPSHVKQLAQYRAVLQKLYPDRPVRAALIWTEVPELMELSGEVLDAALAQVTSA